MQLNVTVLWIVRVLPIVGAIVGAGSIVVFLWERLKRSRGRALRRPTEGRDFLLVVATVVVVAAGGFAVADAIYSAQSGSFFWQSIAFDDIASVSTAIAAAAACASAWLARKPKSDGSGGLSYAESSLIRDAWERRAAGQISPQDFNDLVAALVSLRRAGAANAQKPHDEEALRRVFADHAARQEGERHRDTARRKHRSATPHAQS